MLYNIFQLKIQCIKWANFDVFSAKQVFVIVIN